MYPEFDRARELLAAEKIPCDYDQLKIEAKLSLALRTSVHPERSEEMLELLTRITTIRERTQRAARWLLETAGDSKAVRYFVLAASENFSAIEPPPRVGEARMLSDVPVEDLNVHELYTLANYFLTAAVYGLSHDGKRREEVAAYEDRINIAGLHAAAEHAFEAGNPDAIEFVTILHRELFVPSGVPLRIGSGGDES